MRMFHVVCGSSKPCHRNRKIPALLLFKNYLSTKFFLATGYSLSYQHNILLINPIYDNRLLVKLQYVQYVLFYITIVVCCYNCLYLSLENEQRIMEKKTLRILKCQQLLQQIAFPNFHVGF